MDGATWRTRPVPQRAWDDNIRALLSETRSVAERANSGWRASELDGTLDIPPGHIRALLLHLADELRAPGFASEAMVELVCGQIAIEISRYRQVALHCDRPQGLEPWQLRAVEERLAGDGKTPTLAELAGICSLPCGSSLAATG
jgi:hypothetical protein